MREARKQSSSKNTYRKINARDEENSPGLSENNQTTMGLLFNRIRLLLEEE